MDTDMLLVKPIDDLLNDSAFLGRESANFASMGIIGTEKYSDFAKMCMELYDNMKFSLAKIPTVPSLITSQLVCYGLSKEDITQRLINGLVVYQSDYFYPVYGRKALDKYERFELAATQNSYGVHLWTVSWSDEISMIYHGQVRKGLSKVWARFKRTPFLPIGYWLKVIKACLSTTWLGTLYQKYKKQRYQQE